MATKWVDITELVRWKGHVTGIQRVIQMLSERYENQENARFVVFDNAQNGFCEVDFREAMTRRRQDEQPHSISSEDARPSMSRKVLHIAKKIHQKAKKHLPASYAKAVAKAKDQVVARRHPAGGSNLPQGVAKTTVSITAEDTLLLLAGSWDNDQFIAHIIDLRKKIRPTMVHIVCDMIPIVAPNYSHEGIRRVFKNYMLQILPCMDGVAAISESAKRDIEKVQREYKLPRVPVSVIRLGDDISPIKHPKRPESAATVKKGQYLLSVSTIEVRKNHALLYYMAKAAVARKVEIPQIVIAGKVGWLATDIYEIMQNDPEVKDKFVFLHGLDDEAISWLYQNCLLCIMPSWYEGWGLPVAEALGYGKAAIAADTSSLPEVAGDLLEYFAPYDPLQCLALVDKYANQPKVLERKETEIAKKYRLTTWDQTFAQFDGFVESLK